MIRKGIEFIKKNIKKIVSNIISFIIIVTFLVLIIYRQWLGVGIFLGAQILFALWILYKRRKQYVDIVNTGATLLINRRRLKNGKKNWLERKRNNERDVNKVCDSDMRGLQTKDSAKNKRGGG